MVNTEKKFYLGTTKNVIKLSQHCYAITYLLDECLFYICGRASTLLRNLLFLSLSILLTGCTNTGGGGDFPSGWNPSFPGQPGTFTYDDVYGKYAEFY